MANKGEFVAAVAAGVAGEGKVARSLTKAQVAEVVDAMFKTLEDMLARGEEVVIAGFGSFSVTERAASKGRNLRTGAEVVIPAKRVPKFKAGKRLKDLVAGEAA